jgi:hypothetical protein
MIPHHEIHLSREELVSLYVALARHEADLDETQTKVLERLATMLYTHLSVSEMEGIESYYDGLASTR